MININLRSRQVQSNISKVENAFMPLYKALERKVIKNYNTLKGEWKCEYHITTDIRCNEANAICLEMNAFNDTLRNDVRLFVYCNLGNISKEIKIVDANKADSSDITGFDPADNFALLDNSAYESNITDAENRKCDLITFLTEMTNPNMFAITDYITEVFTRFDYYLNSKWKKINTDKRLEVELTTAQDYESKWFALPIDESKPENHYWLASGCIIDYRSAIMIRPDDDLLELNKLAKFMLKHHIDNVFEMYIYIQKTKPTLLDNQIYKYTDDNLNKVLAKMTPAQIVKNTNTDGWNLSDPFVTNNVDYFMIKDGAIKLMDKEQAENKIIKDMTAVFGAFCNIADIKLNTDRNAKPYWI